MSNGHLDSIGVTCALCHSTVDNSLTQGIGHRQDGWPNRDLNVGAIVALSTALTADQRAAVTSWRKGKFDPRLQARIHLTITQTPPDLVTPKLPALRFLKSL